jgi:hypothetical protein
VFFATTLLATIGYGNFVPSQNSTKTIIVVFSLPLICVFGYALAQIAKMMMTLVSRLEVVVMGTAYKDKGDAPPPLSLSTSDPSSFHSLTPFLSSSHPCKVSTFRSGRRSSANTTPTARNGYRKRRLCRA